MNRIRLFTSGGLFVFAIYCLVFDNSLPFEFPLWVYIVATVYFAIFPIKDIIPMFNYSAYKGKQFKKFYHPKDEVAMREIKKLKNTYNKRAVIAFIFWICFLAVPVGLYLGGVIGRIWIFFFFALSNFSVFFAVFFWCPFHRIFIRSECCNDCRIYNWDSFFQYSFLIFIPNVFTIILFSLGLLSLAFWEVNHHKHPERFYKKTNECLSCENCKMEGCKQGEKKKFSVKLKSSL